MMMGRRPGDDCSNGGPPVKQCVELCRFLRDETPSFAIRILVPFRAGHNSASSAQG